jgi:hypothetical protein
MEAEIEGKYKKSVSGVFHWVMVMACGRKVFNTMHKHISVGC